MGIPFDEIGRMDDDEALVYIEEYGAMNGIKEVSDGVSMKVRKRGGKRGA